LREQEEGYSVETAQVLKGDASHPNTDRAQPAPLNLKKKIIDPVYLPFTGNQLLQHFAPAAEGRWQDPYRHLRYYVRSVCNYHRFGQMPGSPERLGAPLQELKRPCQIEKDERFWLATCLLTHFYATNRVSTLRDLMLAAGFPETPPVEGLADWEECFTVTNPDRLHLFFELFFEERQLPRSGASFWECLAGAADPADLDEEGRELLELMAKDMPDEVPDEVEADILRILTCSNPESSTDGHLPNGLKELHGSDPSRNGQAGRS
jgi:hypothetical protein